MTTSRGLIASAAGAAAALACRQNASDIDVRKVGVAELRDDLMSAGAILEGVQ